MEIRSQRPEDNLALQNIYIEAINHGCKCVYGKNSLMAWTARTNKRFKFMVPERSFVAMVKGEIVAFAGWRPQGEDGDLARIASVYVKPDFMGQGIGKKALKAVHEDIRNKNFSYIHLYASLNAVPFYKSQGYQVESPAMIKVAEGYYISTERMTRKTVLGYN